MGVRGPVMEGHLSRVGPTLYPEALGEAPDTSDPVLEKSFSYLVLLIFLKCIESSYLFRYLILEVF